MAHKIDKKRYKVNGDLMTYHGKQHAKVSLKLRNTAGVE